MGVGQEGVRAVPGGLCSGQSQQESGTRWGTALSTCDWLGTACRRWPRLPAPEVASGGHLGPEGGGGSSTSVCELRATRVGGRVAATPSRMCACHGCREGRVPSPRAQLTQRWLRRCTERTVPQQGRLVGAAARVTLCAAGAGYTSEGGLLKDADPTPLFGLPGVGL